MARKQQAETKPLRGSAEDIDWVGARRQPGPDPIVWAGCCALAGRHAKGGLTDRTRGL